MSPGTILPGAHRRPLAPVAAGLVLAIIAAWSLAMPLMASPDEPSHVIKAAAVVRGQLGGEVGAAPVDTMTPGAPTYVDVPSDLGAAEDLATCYRFDDEESADCQPGMPERGAGPTTAITYAGQYPPLYYALVGWPSLFLEGEAAVYAMRLVSGLLGGALILWGVATTVRGTGRVAGLWAAAVALTPMVLFLAGTVNPNGLEIAAGFAFWAACLELGRSAVARTSVVVQAVVSGAVLVLVRTSGPVWAVLVVAIALVAARPGTVRRLARTRSVRAAAPAALAVAALALAWFASHSDVVTTSGLFPELAAPRLVIALMLLATQDFLEQMVGNFGWLDTASPFPTVLAWFAAAAVVLLVALVLPGARRGRAALGALLLAVVVVPIALTVPTAEAAGMVWQGRYVLPLAVGAPLLAVPLVTASIHTSPVLHRGLARATGFMLAAGHVLAFYWAARRYAEGSDGQWVTFSPSWESPLGFVPAVAVYAVLVGALLAVAVRYAADERDVALLEPLSAALPPAAAAPAELTSVG